LNSWEGEGLILSRTNFSESSIILKVFTRDYGIRKGLIKGGKSNKVSFTFETGNLVSAIWSGRNENVLGNFKCELIKTYSALFLNDTLKFSALISALNLIEFSLLENDSESILFDYTLDLINKINVEKEWLQDYVFWELKLLEKVGFGLNLTKCVLTDSKANLKYVSPKSGCAVSTVVDDKWKKKLLPLPQFLIKQGNGNLKDILNGLKLTRSFLEKFFISIEKKIPFTRNHFIDNIFLIHKIKQDEFY